MNTKKHIFKQSVSLFLAFLLTFSLLGALSVGAADEGSADWGKAEDGIYYISTPADMLAFAAAAVAEGSTRFYTETVKLTSDIDMKDVTWTPIPRFDGTFDGDGHSIKNIVVNKPDTDNVGLLFSRTTGTVKNLRLTGCSVTGRVGVGGVSGNAFNKTCAFENIYVEATVNGVSNIGGIVGSFSGGALVRLSNCVSKCTVEGTGNAVGGLIGITFLNSAVTLTDCAFLGSCKGGDWSGGMVGQAKGSVALTRCVGLGTVTSSTSKAAGLVTMYSDGSINSGVWADANNALQKDPNADISQYVGKIHIEDCYSGAPYAIYRHINRYFRCFEISVINNGVKEDFSGEANGFTTGNPYADLNAASKPFSDAIPKIDKENFDFSDYPVLVNWVVTDAEACAVMPASVAGMLGLCPILPEFHYQSAVLEDGSVKVRFVAVIDDLRYEQVGFEIQANRGGETSKTVRVATSVVYESITAAGETVTASELGGKYIIAVTVTVPADAYAAYDHVFTVCAFTEMQDGTVLTTAAQSVTLAKKA